MVYMIPFALISLWPRAAAHGAVQVLAEQWKLRNVAHANLLRVKIRFFRVLSAQSANTDKSQVQVGSTQGSASNTWNSVDERTTGTANSLNNAKSYIMPYEVPLPLTYVLSVVR